MYPVNRPKHCYCCVLHLSDRPIDKMDLKCKCVTAELSGAVQSGSDHRSQPLHAPLYGLGIFAVHAVWDCRWILTVEFRLLETYSAMNFFTSTKTINSSSFCFKWLSGWFRCSEGLRLSCEDVAVSSNVTHYSEIASVSWIQSVYTHSHPTFSALLLWLLPPHLLYRMVQCLDTYSTTPYTAIRAVRQHYIVLLAFTQHNGDCTWFCDRGTHAGNISVRLETWCWVSL